MHCLQEQKLHHDQKQEKTDRQGGIQEILPFLCKAYPAQGNEVIHTGV
jgi:hypothetical protein